MKNNKKKGISLIVLVITIIVMIILATAIILSISNSGIIPKANEATFKTDMQSYKEAYELYVISNTAKTGGEFNEGSINGENGDEVITEIFGNVPEKYKAGLKIKDGQIIYETEDEKELEIIKEIGMYDNTKIDFKAYLNGSVKISCPQEGLSCKGESDASFASSCNLSNVSTALSLTSGGYVSMGLAKPTKKGTDNLTYDWVKATDSDYFHKTFSIKCDWENGGQIYLAEIKAKNTDSTKPITSSIIYNIKTNNQEVVFNIDDEKNSNKEYVLPTGIPGYVIDVSKIDRYNGATQPYMPYTAKHFVNYDSTTGEVSLKNDSLRIKNVNANSTVEVEIYIYIEAGLENFGWNLDRSSFSDVELTFVGIPND